MKHEETIGHPEESYCFMRSLTFIGGFLNAYSYFTRGGAFVTFHTGNLVRTGLSIVEKDLVQFWSAFTPIIAGFLGAVVALLLKSKITEESYFYKRIIFVEIISFFIIGFIWSDSLHNIVNFALSFIAMVQLSSFRSIKGTTHNTTIMTGNLRTLAQYFSDFLIKRDREIGSELISYLLTFLSFPLGVVVGGALSLLVNQIAIWFCSLILLILAVRRVAY